MSLTGWTSKDCAALFDPWEGLLSNGLSLTNSFDGSWPFSPNLKRCFEGSSMTKLQRPGD